MKLFIGIAPLCLLCLLYCSPAGGTGGTVVAWGDNTYGQTHVPYTLTNAIALATLGGGADYSLALRADDPAWHYNRVAAWGDDYAGQTNPPSASLSDVVALAGGYNHCLAIKANGSVTNWGATFYSVPTTPVIASNDAVSLSAGLAHSLALRADGTIVVAGTNEVGGPWMAPAGLSNVVATACGGGAGLALKADGTVVWWQGLGLTTTNLPVPAEVSNVVAIATGTMTFGDYALALKADGTVAAWSLSGWPCPTNVPPGLEHVVAIAAGVDHCLALRSDGSVVAWGDSRASFDATNVPPGLTHVIAIAAGGAHSLALVSTNNPPVFVTRGLPDRTSIVGDQVFFIAQAIGAWPLHFQWRFNGTNLDGATNAVLKLANVQTNQAGNYSVTVSNLFGAVASSNALLRVQPLIITRQPQSQTNLVGATVTFDVATQDYLLSTYQWRFNGTNLPGATSMSLTLTNLQPTDAGLYSVIISNQFGVSISSDALLRVEPLFITSQPQSQTNLAGATVAFSLTTQAYVPLAYQWRFNGTNLSGATDAALLLTNVQPADAGVYSVFVTNAYGAVTSSNAFLGIIPLLITAQPRDQIRWPGATAAFSVTAQANAPLVYQWQFNGTNLAGATDAALSLTNVQYDQVGLYGVFVSNCFGSVRSLNAHLWVVPVVGWGDNGNGQLNVPVDATNIAQVAGGSVNTLALKTDGTVFAWGGPGLGIASVPAGLTNVIAIAAGSDHALALKLDGTVTGWGVLLGSIPADLDQVVAIDANVDTSLALRANGTVTAWGIGIYAFYQTNLPPGLSNVVAIADGLDHALALKADGTLVAWGDNQWGQTNVPAGLNKVVAIGAGSSHSVALNADGKVVAWGYNGYGQTNVPPDLTNAVQIAVGGDHTLALKADGTVVAWGNNDNGQTNVPPGLSNVIAVAAGDAHSLALVGDHPPRLHMSLANPQPGANGFSMRLPTRTGRAYALEYKNSLAEGNWTALPLAAGNGAILTLTDSTATNSAQRFYRVRQW
jgi:alpha-tubulin suppressor-like RCC1 family protein